MRVNGNWISLLFFISKWYDTPKKSNYISQGLLSEMSSTSSVIPAMKKYKLGLLWMLILLPLLAVENPSLILTKSLNDAHLLLSVYLILFSKESDLIYLVKFTIP